MTLIKSLSDYKGKQTVFTISEIALLANDYTGEKLFSALKYARKSGNMIRISRGFYAFDQNYNRQEFANKFRSPSYISLYTIFQESGMVFQPYQSIFVISNRNQTITIDNQTYIYRKIKDEHLLNPLGIVTQEGINKASPERALCDLIYLDGDEYIDNLRNIDWNLVKKINQSVYNNKSLIKAYVRKNTK